jgi:hypothetical protein
MDNISTYTLLNEDNKFSLIKNSLYEVKENIWGELHEIVDIKINMDLYYRFKKIENLTNKQHPSIEFLDNIVINNESFEKYYKRFINNSNV